MHIEYFVQFSSGSFIKKFRNYWEFQFDSYMQLFKIIIILNITHTKKI